ncbi:hypothetical protein P5673_031175, partial [Acropora cervicornis]
MNQNYAQEYLLRNKCEWIPFKFNAPHFSHMGFPSNHKLVLLLTASEVKFDDVTHQETEETPIAEPDEFNVVESTIQREKTDINSSDL